MTVTGKTLAENLAAWDVKYGHKWAGQDVIRPLSNPIKSSGHIRFVPLICFLFFLLRLTYSSLSFYQNPQG